MNRFSKVAGLALATATVSTALFTGNSSAAADPCSPNHCYGQVSLVKSAGRGIKMSLGVTHLEHSDPANQLATAEMWLGLADGKGGWVELGQIYGVWCDPARQYFSAATTTTGFKLHCEGSAANTPTKTPIRIEHGASASKWNIFINSAWTGTTYTTTADTSSGANAGAETSISTAAVNTAATNLAYMKSDGTWSTGGWDGAFIDSGAPYTTTWMTAPLSYLVKANQSFAPAGARAEKALPAPRTRTEPVAEALRLAALNGVAPERGFAAASAPTVVDTTRSAANALLGDTVRGDNRVKVVQVRGDVVGHALPHPPGTAAPTGTYMVLVMDAATGHALDVVVRDTPAELSRLGTVSALDGPPSS